MRVEVDSDSFTFHPEPLCRMSSTPQPSEAVISFAIKSNGLYQSAFDVIMPCKKQSPN